jgi:hypothetical protein
LENSIENKNLTDRISDLEKKVEQLSRDQPFSFGTISPSHASDLQDFCTDNLIGTFDTFEHVEKKNHEHQIHMQSCLQELQTFEMQDSRTLTTCAIQTSYTKHLQVVNSSRNFLMIHLLRIMTTFHSVTNLLRY